MPSTQPPSLHSGSTVYAPDCSRHLIVSSGWSSIVATAEAAKAARPSRRRLLPSRPMMSGRESGFSRVASVGRKPPSCPSGSSSGNSAGKSTPGNRASAMNPVAMPVGRVGSSSSGLYVAAAAGATPTTLMMLGGRLMSKAATGRVGLLLRTAAAARTATKEWLSGWSRGATASTGLCRAAHVLLLAPAGGPRPLLTNIAPNAITTCLGPPLEN
eukprot:scaffold111352_cov54-Phaeocystis_antarctica.AAC.1